MQVNGKVGEDPSANQLGDKASFTVDSFADRPSPEK